VRGIVKEKSDDDEIPDYITELNTVIAKQEKFFTPETIFNSAFTFRNKSLLQSANHKIVYSFLSLKEDQSKFYLTIYMEVL